MTIHCATFKGHTVNCSDKINQNRVIFFSFGGFCFFLIGFLRRCEFLKALINVLVFCFVYKARKFQLLWINWVKIRNRFNGQLIFKIRFTFCHSFTICTKINLWLTGWTNIIVIHRLLRALIDFFFDNIFHDGLAKHFTDMRDRHFARTEALERDLRLHFLYLGLKLYCQILFRDCDCVSL